MNYIQNGFLGNTDIWRYILVIIVFVFGGVGLFSLPHSTAIAAKIFSGEVDTSRVDDLSYVFSLFDSNINLIFITLPFVGGLLALFLGVKFIHKQTLVNLTTSRSKIDWKRIFFVFGLWGGVTLFVVAVQYFMAPEALVLNFKMKPFLLLCILAIILVPIQTSFEEYLFRGYLMQALGVLAKNRWFPLLITSITFGLLHYANPEMDKLGNGLMLYYIGTGLFLGVITLMDEGMELTLGFHAANNLVTVLLITADWTAFQTHSIFKDISEPSLMSTIAPMFVIYPLLLFVLAKKYKWTNWKEKLTGAISNPQEDVIS